MKFDQELAVPNEQFGAHQTMYISGPLEHDLIFLHHGAGYTAQTWLPLVAGLRKRLPNVCFVAADMRAHGKSVGSGSIDMSLDALVEDVDVLLTYLLRNAAGVVDVHLVGHSLGAAVLAAFSHPERQVRSRGLLKLHSLTMVDIIEDTALSSLERMPAILADIPETFRSVDAAVKWAMTSSHSHHFPGLPVTEGIRDSIASQLSFSPQSNTFSWIANLKAMQPFWDDWFVGLTDSFLAFPESRLLVLAGTDYMDRRMIIAQMQGKFQLAVIRDSGHAIHEDRPDELAELLASLVHKHLKLLNLLRKPK